MIYEYEDFQQAEFDYWTINIEISTGKTKHPILGEEKDGKGTQHTCPKTTNHLCIQITYAPLHHLQTPVLVQPPIFVESSKSFRPLCHSRWTQIPPLWVGWAVESWSKSPCRAHWQRRPWAEDSSWGNQCEMIRKSQGGRKSLGNHWEWFSSQGTSLQVKQIWVVPVRFSSKAILGKIGVGWTNWKARLIHNHPHIFYYPLFTTKIPIRKAKAAKVLGIFRVGGIFP